ncbi:hypothetical protein [Burkholderia sp. Ac-20353]|uniref:hypothetical protein n=1 Tax=Burkholderia sp. Ac-20353 TaxID=2703894 RepID=UPI00197B69A7|nr:hypothetical protein [Burkholderia sp. Ac-20353]MBN3785868.1 hypothetical protein [Burkholderia sp. Ac-20353]
MSNSFGDGFNVPERFRRAIVEGNDPVTAISGRPGGLSDDYQFAPRVHAPMDDCFRAT